MQYNGIAISGKMGSGKDFLFTQLSKLSNKYKRVSFAQPIYWIAQHDLGMVDKDRKLLQAIGTEIGRDKVDTDIWIKMFEVRAMTLMHKGFIPVVTDVRFENELFFLRRANFLTVRVTARKRIRSKRCGITFSGLEHPSETALDGVASAMFDYTVVNDMAISQTDATQRQRQLMKHPVALLAKKLHRVFEMQEHKKGE